MGKQNKKFFGKSLLITILTVIFLCAAALFSQAIVSVISDTKIAKADGTEHDKKEISLTLDNVSPTNELERRIYGNSYNPITATAVETISGNPAENYSYVIQYNNEDASGEWTMTVPTNAGRYSVRAYGAETEFYLEAISPSALLVIDKRTIQPVFTDTHNTGGNVGEKVYDGEPYNIGVAFSNVVSGDVITPVLSGTVGAVSASDDAYEIVVGDFTAEGSTLADNYLLGGDTTYTYYIRKKPITVIWGNLHHVYDGMRKKATATVEPTSPAPSQPLVISGGNMFGAGDYNVTAALSSEDSENFILSNPNAVLVIEKFLAIIQLGGTARSGEEATLTMSPTTPIPNGEHYYVIGKLAYNTTLSTDWTPTSPISGTYRVWVAGHDEDEYEISNLFFNYDIKVLRGRLKIIKPITEIVWDEDYYVYNAAVQTVSAIGKLTDGTEIPLNVSFNREFKNAGEYIATATIVDSEQYEFVSGLSNTKNYTITKRNVSVSWINTSFIYNAQAQKPTATWTDTVALNAGSELVVSGEQVNASDTPYTATVSVSGSDANNFTITNDTQNFTIGKKTVYVWWGIVNFTYDGTQKIPTASWNIGDVVPIGDLTIHYDEMVNVGEYTAYITYDGSDKDNFNLLSTTKIIRIHKASLRVDLVGFANYGTEAVLSWSINENFSDRIPDAETDYVNDALNSVMIETDWTPFSPMGQQYYVIYAGQNQASYLDGDLMPNYMVDWRKSVFYPMKADISSIDWSENDYTYNGTVQTITAIGRTLNGITVNLEIAVNKEFKNAANDYVATALISTADVDNFEFEYGVIATKDYEIKRAMVVLEWDNITATYDGTQKTPTVAWVAAALLPEGAPTVIYMERINAGSYTVQAEYNGADKNNFVITGDSETLIIARSEITVSVLLTESGITFGDEMQAHVSAVWHTAEDSGNNALLERLISGYSAGNNAGIYTITLDFSKAEDENRRSPETYLDNYSIAEIITATLTVNKKAITATDIAKWIADGNVSFKDKTVAEDGNVHMIYAEIRGEAAEVIEVIAYKDKDGVDFNGASIAGNYGITALIFSANENYETHDITLTARLRISIKTAIMNENGEIRGYIIGLDPDYEYTATLTENQTEEYSEHVGENGIEMVITITDENGNPANDELTYIIYPPNGYDADTGAMYIVNGGTIESLSGTIDGNGGIGFDAQTDNGSITLIASGMAKGLNIDSGFFWLIIAGTTLCGFIVILILIKKIRDEYAEK